jgi:DNA replication protein DnaC
MIPEQYEKAKYTNVPKDIRDRLEVIMTSRRGMYIHGSVGTGKTYIAYALKAEWDSRATVKSMFWDATELMREIKADFDRPAEAKTRAEQRIMDFKGLLFIDDIGAEKMTDFVAETMHVIINHRYNNRMPVIFTSNFPVSDLANHLGGLAGERIASRIVQECDIIELTGDDKRMKDPRKIKLRSPFAN